MDDIKKKLVEALGECYGVVTDACRKCDVARSTYYNWLKDDEEFKKAVDDTQEEAIDFVEGKLFNMIKNDDTTAAIFYLKTKGKKRGYVERQELNLGGEVGIKQITGMEIK